MKITKYQHYSFDRNMDKVSYIQLSLWWIATIRTNSNKNKRYLYLKYDIL